MTKYRLVNRSAGHTYRGQQKYHQERWDADKLVWVYEDTIYADTIEMAQRQVCGESPVEWTETP